MGRLTGHSTSEKSLENLKTKETVYEENLDVVFNRFAFTGKRRVVPSPTDRRD
jgi:hypothetical protein